jgi:hypothetical protein
LSYHRSTRFAFYEHPIIASEESQRNPGNLALFGIKNAGRPAGEHKLVVDGGVDQLLAVGSAVRLLDDYIVLGNHVIELAGAAK